MVSKFLPLTEVVIESLKVACVEAISKREFETAFKILLKIDEMVSSPDG